jgi:hypothetical protein
MTNIIPNRASDSGPEPQEFDWRDWIDNARDFANVASKTEAQAGASAETRNRHRIAYINRALDALLEAKELLCR